ncbi:MAG: 23S rRNA (uracil(1939)-C(5))-methyltransferase RlmD [Deltaproteobacteria bacterium]|nr:23S rRNA (uracil(1939)-C(5))-methyltransferase RlmD [Deltaproteobacteria bacterium]
MESIRKGQELEVTVEKLAFGGKAIARVNGFVVFLERALPGQRVTIQIHKKKSRHAEGRVLEVLSQPSAYVTPFCSHFGFCGGCRWQDLPYEDQLHWKREHVIECLTHLGGIKGNVVEYAVPSPLTTFYRNKMEFTFSDRRWLLPEEVERKDIRFRRDFALGLHVPGTFDKVFNVEECFLESAQSVEILREVRRWCAKSPLAPYSIKRQSGFWRFLVVREGKRTGQTLVHLITSGRDAFEDEVNALAEHILDRFPGITTFVHSLSLKKAQVATGDVTRVVTGPGFIEEILGRARFRISAHSFFQTNPYGAEKLYEAIADFGELTGRETVWDLYCGTGSIALFIAPLVRRVVGFEMVEEAVADAHANCTLNGIENCTFHAGDIKDLMRKAGDPSYCVYGRTPDLIIADPPRAGMHPHVVQAIMEIGPKSVIAVSCNPSTLTRDLALLLEKYEVERILPFDMFPHTPHIECVVKLNRVR